MDSEEFYAIELKSIGKVIGNISCISRDYEAKEVGYIVNSNFQRKGCAAEALSAVIRHAFRSGTHRGFAECDPENERSWRLLEKAGFKREAHFRKNLYFHKDSAGNPIWKDTYVYARLNDQ